MEASYIFGARVDASEVLSPERVRAMISEGRRIHAGERPTEAALWNLVDALARAWSDPGFPPRARARALLPRTTGFSPEMIEKGLDAMAAELFSSHALQKKVRTELQKIPGPHGIAHGVRFDPASGTALQWRPLGVVLHVLAGNVFLGGAGSLLEGLLTGNVNILKMASDETAFLPLLLESIETVDPARAFLRRIACVAFPSSAKDVMSAFKQECDGVVVWGGEQAVRGWREGLPASCRLVVFGPKLSLAVVTSGGIAERGVAEIAERIAGEIAIWDQNACTAPQVCYVEGEDNARALVAALGDACARMEDTLPAGAIDFQTACEIRKIRGLHEVRSALGEGALSASPTGLKWTVFLDPALDPDPSPLHRTMRIVPYARLDAVLEAIAPVAPQLQTLGLCAGAQEDGALRHRLADAGALRLLPLGRMSGGESDDPHDGAYDLPQLMKLVCHRYESETRHVHPEDRAPVDARRREIDERLALLERAARRTPLYSARLERHGPLTLSSLADFPFLTRADLETHTPPFGSGLLAPDVDAPTDARFACQGGYVTRSGGSTGEPKFSIYDGDDWEAMMDHGVRVFLGAGLRKGDRLANCFLAGDLYGSFVSFDHINARIGVTTFAYGSAVTGSGLARAWRDFRLNAIMGVPATIIPALREAYRLEPHLRLSTVVFAGQPMSRADAAWLREALGVSRVSSIIGANDGGQIGFQCEALSGAQHHAVDEYNFIECIDASGRPVPDGESGRLVITTLRKQRLPLIRYEIGDQGRIVRQGCPCGRTGRVFEHLGRADDTLTVGLMNLPLSDLHAALAETSASEIQVIIRATPAGETLELRLEMSDDATLGNRDDATLVNRNDAASEASGAAGGGPRNPSGRAAQIRAHVLAALPTVAKRLEQGALAGLDVVLAPVGSLVRNPRTGKIKGVIDER